jgi:hypothetical protein
LLPISTFNWLWLTTLPLNIFTGVWPTHSRRFELGLWCLTPLSTIFQLYRGSQTQLLVEGPEYPRKTTDLSQVTDKLYHRMLYRVHPAWVGFKLTTLVVIGTDCICSCKSNYHTIMTTTTPIRKGRKLKTLNTWQTKLDGIINLPIRGESCIYHFCFCSL